ncbi:hypothetical protein KAX02_06705 [candidate division WOR-3 bacterium]|nr:hypothetical protein [candidate division WOR-3 bacterium]
MKTYKIFFYLLPTLLLTIPSIAGEWKSYIESNGMPCQEVSALAVDGNTLWVGTYGMFNVGGNEILSFDIEKEEWTSYSPEKVKCGFVNTICVDDDKVWFGTDSGFVLYSKPTQEWKIYSPEMGLPGPKVYEIVTYRDYLWLATFREEDFEYIGCGLTRFDKMKEEFRTFTIEDGLPSNNIGCIYLKDELLWIGTENGLINYNPWYEQFALHIPSFPNTDDVMLPGDPIDEFITCMAYDNGLYWFGTYFHMHSYSERDDKWTEYSDGPAPVLDILLTNKRAWVVSMCLLMIYNRISKEWQEVPIKFLSENHLSGLNIKAICASPDYLWVGTADGGLSRYTFDKDEQPTFQGLKRGLMMYPELVSGYERPRTTLHTLVQSVLDSNVEGIYDCFTEQALIGMKEAIEERETNATDLFLLWFERAYPDSWQYVPNDMAYDMYKEFQPVLIENKWLFDVKPEEDYEETEEIEEMIED